MSEARRRVVVVDDEQGLRDVLEVGLTHEGFDVRTADGASAALALVREWNPEAIVLDVMMPVVDGIHLIPLLRKVSQAPILLLTAKNTLQDRVAGLRSGADDYLVKPFELEELVVRIRAALRRPYLDVGEHLRYTDLVLNLVDRTAHRGGRLLDLSTREFDLAAALLRRPRRVFSRDELIELVWGGTRDITRGTVDAYISYLRAKVDAPPAKALIKTVRGVGYTLREEYPA